MKFTLNFDVANCDLQDRIDEDAEATGVDKGVLRGQWQCQVERDALPQISEDFRYCFRGENSESVDFCDNDDPYDEE